MKDKLKNLVEAAILELEAKISLCMKAKALSKEINISALPKTLMVFGFDTPTFFNMYPLMLEAKARSRNERKSKNPTTDKRVGFNPFFLNHSNLHEFQRVIAEQAATANLDEGFEICFVCSSGIHSSHVTPVKIIFDHSKKELHMFSLDAAGDNNDNLMLLKSSLQENGAFKFVDHQILGGLQVDQSSCYIISLAHLLVMHDLSFQEMLESFAMSADFLQIIHSDLNEVFNHISPRFFQAAQGEHVKNMPSNLRLSEGKDLKVYIEQYKVPVINRDRQTTVNITTLIKALSYYKKVLDLLNSRTQEELDELIKYRMTPILSPASLISIEHSNQDGASEKNLLLHSPAALEAYKYGVRLKDLRELPIEKIQVIIQPEIAKYFALGFSADACIRISTLDDQWREISLQLRPFTMSTEQSHAPRQ